MIHDLEIHVALVSVYPTLANAHLALAEMPRETPYLGTWLHPTPERPEVHVFSSQATPADLRRNGFTEVNA